jgi:hypothetical protein
MPIAVYYYDPEAEEPFFLLPNVVALRIDYREGPEPPVARFRYLFSDAMSINAGWPNRVDQVWPIDAQGAYVAMQDDRLVVAASNPDGEPIFLFDGFVQSPQADITGGHPGGGSEGASFTAVGVAARAWDDVIRTRIQRDTDQYDDTSGDHDFEIEAPCRFNPADQRPGSLGGFLPNSTHDSFYTVIEGESDSSEGDEEDDQPEDGGGGDSGYPVFLDPLLLEKQEADGGNITYLSPWYVSDALLYLILAQPNPGDDYVTWPDGKTIASVLETKVPPDGETVFDPESAVPADCVIRDYDATGKTLPHVMADLLQYAGFYMVWDIDSNADGMPETFLRFFRKDGAATGTPKAVYLGPPGASLSQGSPSNVTQLHLARDCNAIVNAWRTETAPKQFEITVILAPLFQPTPGDEQAANRTKFQQANLTDADATTRRKYRWYGADECGDGHWNARDQEMSEQALDFISIFPPPEGATKGYCTRYRPGTDTLISRDSKGRPRRAVLECWTPTSASFDDTAYNADPYIQTEKDDPAFVWKEIPKGWRLLDDRLGIEVTAPDPEAWATGNGNLPKISGISQQTIPGQSGHKPFWLRLTTPVEADERIFAEAVKRVASPSRFERFRSADAADHFRYCAVAPGSIHYEDAGGSYGDDPQPKVIRDDTKKATTHAMQLRSAYEMPPVAGSITLRGINLAYSVGDRIGSIDGRDISLQSNIGASQGESPTYPNVIGISYHLDGGQYTELILSDRRSDMMQHGHHHRRHHDAH